MTNFSSSSNIFKSSSGYPYSRNHRQGSNASGTDSQFYFEVIAKNNIYAEDTNGPTATFTQKFNSVDWDFTGAGGGTPSTGANFSNGSKILWWDYTYISNSGSFPMTLVIDFQLVL